MSARIRLPAIRRPRLRLPRPGTLQAKVILFSGLIAFIGVSTIAVFVYETFRRNAIRSAVEESLRATGLIAYNVFRAYPLSDARVLQGYVTSTHRKMPGVLEMEIINRDQVVVAATAEGRVDRRLDDAVVASTLRRAAEPDCRVVTGDQWTNQVTYPITSRAGAGLPLGVVRVTYSLDEIRGFYHATLMRMVVFLVLFGPVFFTLLYVFLTRTIVNPVNRAAAFAGEIDRGRFDVSDLRGASRDEMGALARSLNRMRDNLRGMTDDLRASRDELARINRGLEEKVRERTSDLEEALVRLEEVSEYKTAFISMLSHDVRTPLTAIKSSLGILRGEKAGALSEGQRKFVSIADRNAERIYTMLSNLLDFDKIESGKTEYRFESTDLVELVEKTISLLMPLMDEKEIAARTLVEKDVPLILADGPKLEQVLANLVGNAVKFTEPGGAITMRVRRDHEAAGVIVTVEDTGIGIPEEQRATLFSKFEQGSDQHTTRIKGSGLGLFLCREYVEAHGGRIDVESRTGEGSKFLIHLPLDPTEGRGAPKNGADARTTGGLPASRT